MQRKPLATAVISVLLITLFLVACVPSLKGESEASLVQWSKTYGEPDRSEAATSVVQTSDGGYAVAGRKQDSDNFTFCWLVRTNADGNMLWIKTYGPESYGSAVCIIQTADGGFALAGNQISYPNNVNFWIVKTDSTGEMQWTRTYDNGVMDYPLYSVARQAFFQTSDGGYAIASKGLLIKTDSTGNIQWTQKYYGITSVLQTKDQGFAMMGASGGANYHIWLAKANSSGSMQWNITYLNNDIEYPSSFAQTNDGGFALAGQRRFSVNGFSDILFLKTDSVGNLIWGKTWGDSAADGAVSMVQATDGGYSIASFTSHADFALIKINSDGNQQWAKKYVSNSTEAYPDHSYPNCVIQTNDGGYAVAGYSADDLWLVKTDSAGNNPNSSDIIVPLTNSISPTPLLVTQSPVPTTAPTYAASPSPNSTATPQPVHGFLDTNLLVAVFIMTVAVIVIGLLMYIKKYKRKTALVD
jgi:hypothetical protein